MANACCGAGVDRQPRARHRRRADLRARRGRVAPSWIICSKPSQATGTRSSSATTGASPLDSPARSRGRRSTAASRRRHSHKSDARARRASAWNRRFVLGLIAVSTRSTLLLLGIERLRHDVRELRGQSFRPIVGARGGAVQVDGVSGTAARPTTSATRACVASSERDVEAWPVAQGPHRGCGGPPAACTPSVSLRRRRRGRSRRAGASRACSRPWWKRTSRAASGIGSATGSC